MVLAWVLWAPLVSDAVYRFSNFAHPLVHPAALYVAARLAVALDDPCPLIMLGAAIHLTPLWIHLRVATCGVFSELKAGTALRVNGVPSSQSSDSCATGSGGADVGGGVDETPHEQDGATPSARAAGFTRAAALLALFVYGFTKTFYGQLGSLFDKVPTASVALTGATATTSASSTPFMGSLNVSKVLSVASALLVVVVLLIARSVRAACIKLHHLEGDDRFINVGTGSADATRPVPTTAPSTSRSGSMSISTLFWLIGVSITGKVVDYATCPDGTEAGLSFLGLRLLGGGKRKKRKQEPAHCNDCNRDFPNAGAKALHKCKKDRPDAIPAPEGFERTTYRCVICRCGAGLCRFWGGVNKDGKGGHLGCHDVEQVRAADNKKSNASREGYRAREKQQGITKGGCLGEDRIDWESPSYGNPFESKIAALLRFIGKTPGWRKDATFLPRLAAYLFDLDGLDDDKKTHLAGPHGPIYTRCNEEAPNDPNIYPRKDGSSIHYYHLAEVVETLWAAGDAGKLALLKLLVASKLLAALEPWMSGEMRRIFATSRTNARGDSCAKKLDQKVKAGCSGVLRLRKLVLELAGLQFEGREGGGSTGEFGKMWQYGGFGLRTSKADLIRLTERLPYVCQILTPEEGSKPGCDFGTLYALTQIFQAFAAKIGDEALVGNGWHRQLSRGQGLDVRDTLDAVGPSDSVDFAVMLHLGLIILFRNIDTSNMAALFRFFTETYDATVATRKTDRAYELRANDDRRTVVSKERECLRASSALDGYDIAFWTKKTGFVGHDPFGNDERDAEIIAALARNLERLCKNIPWDVSMISGRAWGGDPELREKLLKKLMPLADLAFKLYHTEFAWRITAAGDDVDKLLRAVREGWRAMDAGMTRDRDNFLYEVDVAFKKLAPGLLEPLKSKRVIDAVIHDFSKPNWREGVTAQFLRDRVGYEFGKVVPTPAPAPSSRGALKPANSPQRLPKKPRT